MASTTQRMRTLALLESRYLFCTSLLSLQQSVRYMPGRIYSLSRALCFSARYSPVHSSSLLRKESMFKSFFSNRLRSKCGLTSQDSSESETDDGRAEAPKDFAFVVVNTSLDRNCRYRACSYQVSSCSLYSKGHLEVDDDIAAYAQKLAKSLPSAMADVERSVSCSQRRHWNRNALNSALCSSLCVLAAPHCRPHRSGAISMGS